MDVFDAAYRVAHDYRDPATGERGAVALAQRLGKNPGTFLNEVNPAQDGHKLGVDTATAMQVVAADHRILHAMAHTLGEVCFPVPNLSNVSDAALLEHLTRIGAEGGDFHRALCEALADRRFTRRELARVTDEAMEFIAAIAETLGRIEGLIDE